MKRNDAEGFAQRLYARVPGHYRGYDAERGQPLLALLRIVGEPDGKGSRRRSVVAPSRRDRAGGAGQSCPGVCAARLDPITELGELALRVVHALLLDERHDKVRPLWPPHW